MYGFSVVDGVCPPLFSRAGCTQIGAVIDCEHHAVSARRLAVRAYGLGVDSGHYTMSVDECEPLCTTLPDGFQLPVGVAASALQPKLSAGDGRPDCTREAHGSSCDATMQAVQGQPPDEGLPEHPQRLGGRQLCSRFGGWRDDRGHGREGPNEAEESGSSAAHHPQAESAEHPRGQKLVRVGTCLRP